MCDSYCVTWGNSGKVINTYAAVSHFAAYRGLDAVAHGKVPAFSLVYAYYTGNRLSTHWNVIVERL